MRDRSMGRLRGCKRCFELACPSPAILTQVGTAGRLLNRQGAKGRQGMKEGLRQPSLFRRANGVNFEPQRREDAKTCTESPASPSNEVRRSGDEFLNSLARPG